MGVATSPTSYNRADRCAINDSVLYSIQLTAYHTGSYGIDRSLMVVPNSGKNRRGSCQDRGWVERESGRGHSKGAECDRVTSDLVLVCVEGCVTKVWTFVCKDFLRGCPRSLGCPYSLRSIRRHFVRIYFKKTQSTITDVLGLIQSAPDVYGSNQEVSGDCKGKVAS